MIDLQAAIGGRPFRGGSIMVQAKYQITGTRPLDRLVNKALKRRTRLGYSRRSLRRYRTIWRHLAEFSREGDFGDAFSTDLAASFLAAHRIQGEVLRPKDAWRLHAVYGIKILGAFARDGHIQRWRTDMQRV